MRSRSLAAALGLAGGPEVLQGVPAHHRNALRRERPRHLLVDAGPAAVAGDDDGHQPARRAALGRHLDQRQVVDGGNSPWRRGAWRVRGRFGGAVVRRRSGGTPAGTAAPTCRSWRSRGRRRAAGRSRAFFTWAVYLTTSSLLQTWSIVPWKAIHGCFRVEVGRKMSPFPLGPGRWRCRGRRRTGARDRGRGRSPC